MPIFMGPSGEHGSSAAGANGMYGCAAARRRLQAFEDYREQMERDDDDIDLLDCALLIAKHAHPALVRASTPRLAAFSPGTAGPARQGQQHLDCQLPSNGGLITSSLCA